MVEVAGATLEWWQAILAVVVIVVGSARLTRIITYDDFPPIVRLRIWYDSHTSEEWSKLVHCPWCMGPWVALMAMSTFAVSSYVPVLAAIWWVFWGWLTLSYWVSQYVHFDEGKGE